MVSTHGGFGIFNHYYCGDLQLGKYSAAIISLCGIYCYIKEWR